MQMRCKYTMGTSLFPPVEFCFWAPMEDASISVFPRSHLGKVWRASRNCRLPQGNRTETFKLVAKEEPPAGVEGELWQLQLLGQKVTLALE